MRGIFLYPNEPVQIAAAIEGAVKILRANLATYKWKTWKDFSVAGQLIFCEICKKLRFSEFVFADVTTLNFNLLFEIGFALGLRLPVVPIRDTSIITNKREFEELGLLDTIGYLDFQNSNGLSLAIRERMPFKPLPTSREKINFDAPIYLMRSPIDTEGALRMLSLISESGTKFRSFDVREVPRISIHEARRQVGMSLAIVAHLLSPERQGALVHNARCALIAGLGMAQGKTVLLLQEGNFRQPIDYRDIVSVYSHPDQVAGLLKKPILNVISRLQDAKIRAVRAPNNILENLDLGDVAAENEVDALQSYFVRTSQFREAKRGKANLVTGRKGAGKTAIFYTIYQHFSGSRSIFVLDIKPEGQQFTRFRETVLSKLTPGVQEHTLIAFWNYILLCEIAHKIINTEDSWAQLDFERRKRFDALVKVYSENIGIESGDFSERLLRAIETISKRHKNTVTCNTPGELTKVLFREDIRQLEKVVSEFLEEKKEVWLLVDNLDKGWPMRAASREDILILRTLIESARKLQRSLSEKEVEFHSLVFIRNDIQELLVANTSDKGKDTSISLDYDDEEIFREIVYQRLKASTKLNGSFDFLWAAVFDTHIGTQDSFHYIVERTLMRPRDLLSFLRIAVEIAMNRGHERVKQDDITKAEENFSEDILLSLSFEIRDVYSTIPDPLYGFLGASTGMDLLGVYAHLSKAGFEKNQFENVLKLLVWFGFLGVQSKEQEAPRYAYQVRYNLDKLLSPANKTEATYFIHPAFRKALECKDQTQGKFL